MKKHILSVLFLFLGLSPIYCFATEELRTEMKKDSYLTPYLGVGIFNIKDIGGDYSARTGVLVGAVGELPTGIENLSWTIGFEYFQAGAQREYVYISSGSTAIKEEIDLYYLALPCKVNYAFSSGQNNVQYKVLGGVTVARLISAKGKSNYFGVEDSTDITSNFNQTDIIGSLGVGTDINAFGGKMVFEAEYMHGLMDVVKDGGGRNEGLIARAGFAITL